MRLIKMVGKVYQSGTPKPEVGSKFFEFFDLSRKKKIIDHLQESKLINEETAKKLEQENKQRYDEALLKAQKHTT